MYLGKFIGTGGRDVYIYLCTSEFRCRVKIAHAIYSRRGIISIYTHDTYVPRNIPRYTRLISTYVPRSIPGWNADSNPLKRFPAGGEQYMYLGKFIGTGGRMYIYICT